MKCRNQQPPIAGNESEARAHRLIMHAIKKYNLNLKGLTVYTEAASGAYAYTPLICAAAGASKVIALAKDTRWGTAANAIHSLDALAKTWELKNIVPISEKDHSLLAESDILMNSGNVRPIDMPTVASLKSTCVIPLMWETWEWRPEELNMAACREKGILVLGTDETIINFRRFTGIMYLKMLLKHGFEINTNKYLLLTSSPIGEAVCRTFHDNGADFRWTTLEPTPHPTYADQFIPPSQKGSLLDYLSQCDACICDDRFHYGSLIGEGGLLTAAEIKQYNRDVFILNRSGDVDIASLNDSGITVCPNRENKHGYPNFTTASLGVAPIIELVSAGICVAQVMARSRLAGQSTADAARTALASAPAQDFPQPFTWIA